MAFVFIDIVNFVVGDKICRGLRSMCCLSNKVQLLTETYKREFCLFFSISSKVVSVERGFDLA